jgi:transcriptional regulator
LEHVTNLTRHHEADSEKPWSVSDAPADYISGLLRFIVGFEMQVSKIQGKWKMSQDESKEDREGVKLGLLKRNRPRDASVFKEIQAHEPITDHSSERTLPNSSN